MAEKLLLDTNAVIAVLNADPAVLERLAEVEMFISSITFGELFLGAYKSSRVSQNLARLERLAADYTADNALLSCDIETARHYGRIKRQL